MNAMDYNKILAALLVAGIVASLSGFIAKRVAPVEKVEKSAYVIEGAAEDAAAGVAAAPAIPEPVLDQIAAADVSRGQQISKICGACHSFTKGGPNGVGPNLWGVIGRAKGAHAGYDYSAGMKAKGGTWTYADLNHFLWKPAAFVGGTKMIFVGLKKAGERAAIMAYLRTVADSAPALPSASEIEKEKAELAPPALAAPADKDNGKVQEKAAEKAK